MSLKVKIDLIVSSLVFASFFISGTIFYDSFQETLNAPYVLLHIILLALAIVVAHYSINVISKTTTQGTIKEMEDQIRDLIEVGYSLTSERNFDKLMEKILLSAKKLSNADAGTLYILDESDQTLKFTVVQTDSLNIKMGGTAGEITWPKLQMYKDAQPNRSMVAVVSALDKKLINIGDVYTTTDFNFDGTKAFDSNTGYRSKSMLVIPMTNHENDVVGVIQLINKKDKITGESIEFTPIDEDVISSMGSQAAVTISNMRLISELELLLDSFIKVIADAIDKKSPYTGKHIEKVAHITLDLVDAVNADETVFKDIHFTENERNQMRIAAWMHDMGKITTPDYIIDKATKLERVFDRIDLVELRFELLLKHILMEKMEGKISEEEYRKLKDKYEDDLIFLRGANVGGEFMKDEHIQRVKDIAEYEYEICGEKRKMLTEDEVHNLTIAKGTITTEERNIINNHAQVSLDMLNLLPFPKKLKRVGEIAGGHHEKLSGKGYPLGLKGDEISFEARIVAIADIFEALTSHDRPYKRPNTLSTAFKILGFMVKDEELDPKLVDFFIQNKVYEKFAQENLLEEQKDA